MILKIFTCLITGITVMSHQLVFWGISDFGFSD
jgi:hypothetical protein